jgi:hypothetical protein
MSEILHSKCNQYWIPYCGTEHVISIYWNVCLMMVTVKTLKVKVTLRGFFFFFSAWVYCILTPTSSRIHLQWRHASYRRARPLPAKAGTIRPNFASISVIYKNPLGSFTCRKAGTWDILFYFLSEGRHTEDIPDGFGRVWTRELGFQWPVC